jgi:hypothetical protein
MIRVQILERQTPGFNPGFTPHLSYITGGLSPGLNPGVWRPKIWAQL